MKEETVYFWKILGAFVIVIVIITAIGWVVRPVNKMVERQVLVNSHQYIEGMEQRANILKANIVELELMMHSGQGNMEDLQAQKRALKAQLLAITK